MNYGSDKVGFILVDGYDLRGETTDITDDGHEAILDGGPTQLGEAWDAPRDTGMSKSSLTQSGYFNDAVASTHDAFIAGQGLTRVLTYATGGNVLGALFVGFKGALQTKYSRVLAMVKLHRANATYMVSGERESGRVIHALAQHSASGDTHLTPYDNGASSLLGGSAYLQVSEMTGPSSLTVKLRHSADNVTFVDLVTFAAVVPLRKGQRVTVAGTINRYVCSLWTVTGAGTFTFMAGLARN